MSAHKLTTPWIVSPHQSCDMYTSAKRWCSKHFHLHQLCDIFPWGLQERFVLKQAEAEQAQQTLRHHSQLSKQMLLTSVAELGELHQQLAEAGWQQQQQPCDAAPSTAPGKHAASVSVSPPPPTTS